MIDCSFEQNFCGWQNVQKNSSHVWKRHNAKQLGNGNIPGPEMDHNDNQEGFFVVTQNLNSDDHGQFQIANLKSPLLKASEHPIECFCFWYKFGVKNLGD